MELWRWRQITLWWTNIAGWKIDPYWRCISCISYWKVGIFDVKMFGMLDWNHQIIQSIFPCSCFFFYIFLTASDLNLWVFLQATAEMQNQFGWKNNAKCSKGWEIVEELRNHPRPRIFNDLSQDSDQDILLTDWSTTISHTVSGNLLSHLASKVRCQQCVCVRFERWPASNAGKFPVPCFS